jgi:hypothetical protein
MLPSTTANTHEGGVQVKKEHFDFLKLLIEEGEPRSRPDVKVLQIEIYTAETSHVAGWRCTMNNKQYFGGRDIHDRDSIRLGPQRRT